MSDLPETGKVLKVGIRCSHCIHFKTLNYTTDATCNKLGILGTSKPCKRFSLDAYSLKFSDTEGFIDSLQELPVGQLNILAALLVQEKHTRKYGYRIGEKVYVKLGQPCKPKYKKVTVIKADKDYVYVQGAFRGMILHNSIVSIRDYWYLKRKRKAPEPVVGRKRSKLNMAGNVLKVRG